MTSLPIFQIDAFTTDRAFSGNPAAVVPLQIWFPDETLQLIALENNLSETAFFVKNGGGDYYLRWFTPTTEVNLCGHATLASAYALWNELEENAKVLQFQTKSGTLEVSREEDLLWLNFPADVPRISSIKADWEAIFGLEPLSVLQGKEDLMLVFDNADTVAQLKPDFTLLNKIKTRGIICTAKCTDVDFVSRFFCPQVGIDEDPATGSTHTVLFPYWAEQLGKKQLNARQLSARKGFFKGEANGERVKIGGQAKLFLRGNIYF